MKKSVFKSLMSYVIVIFSVLIAGFAQAAIIKIPTDYPTIQQGIDAAVNGDTVLVTDGTYKGIGNRDIDFKGKTITAISENGAESTIIDCENEGRGFYFHSDETKKAILSGFTITDGTSVDTYRGAIYCMNSSPTIENNVIVENNGGGIYCNNSAPIIQNNKLENNRSKYSGGGICCVNSSAPNIQNNKIINNSTNDMGGGIYCNASAPQIIGNTINYNIASIRGGGICAWDLFERQLFIIGNIIDGNSAKYDGGGIRLHYAIANLVNNLINNNTSEKGAGICCSYTSKPKIVNCTISGNIASQSGGGIAYFDGNLSTLINTIIWANKPNGIDIDILSSVNASYSDIQEGCPGEGNINIDPLFVDAKNGDYHLQDNSPCISSGTMDDNVPVTDIDGNIRPNPSGSKPDMGCYENLLGSTQIFPHQDIKLIKLYEDDSYFKFLLTRLDLIKTEIKDENVDVFNGQIAISVITPQGSNGVDSQRSNPMIPGWNYEIVEKPTKENESRWIMFAWKKIGGTGIMIQFADDGNWGAGPQPFANPPVPNIWGRRYIAGDNLTGWTGIQVSKSAPIEWEIVIRDLFADFGAFTLTGIALTPFNNSGLFDSIYLGQNENELRKLLADFGKSSNKSGLSINSAETSIGSEFTVQLNINDANGISSGDITIKYDPNILSVGKIETTPLTSDMSLIPNTSMPGQIKIAMAGASVIPSGNGSLIDITFTVNSKAIIGTETVIQLVDTELYDESGKAIPMSIENGTIKIIQPCIKGDVNNDGNIKSNDAMMILRISAGLLEPDDYQKCAADINDDGKIGSNDATIVLRKAAGLGTPTKDIIANRRINISLSETYGLKGEIISVPITVDNADFLSSGDISIRYDNKVLRAIDVLVSPSNEEGTNDGLLMASNTNQSGLISISFANVERLNSGKLADIKFEVLADDISPLTFKTAELYGYDVLPLNTKFMDKQFKSWAIKPQYSELLQNFPNPFNPETWIPYQLNEAGEVAIRIHNVAGDLVREIRLGYKPAGLYTNQDRSAYWNGRNETGEQVSSGVYFYTIQAGKYIATRKMLLLK